jgi:hypothetical protein
MVILYSDVLRCLGQVSLERRQCLQAPSMRFSLTLHRIAASGPIALCPSSYQPRTSGLIWVNFFLLCPVSGIPYQPPADPEPVRRQSGFPASRYTRRAFAYPNSIFYLIIDSITMIWCSPCTPHLTKQTVTLLSLPQHAKRLNSIRSSGASITRTPFARWEAVK